MTAARGFWNMSCWNALSQGQQERLIKVGNLPIFSLAEGIGCSNGAEVAIETDMDESPGPRFYCRLCAINFIWQQAADKFQQQTPTTDRQVSQQ